MTGNDLKRLREQAGKTQTEFAELLKYQGKVHIARLEARGRRKLPDGAIARVRAAGLDKIKSRKSRAAIQQ